jgi:hypothetical protein
MVEFTLSLALQFLQTAGILVGIIYYITIMRNQQKTRELTLESYELARKAQDQAFETRQMQFGWNALERVFDKDFMRRMINVIYHQEYSDYEDWREKYGPSTNPDAYVDWFTVTSTFQSLGYLVQSKVLDIEILSQFVRPRGVIFLWERVEPITKIHRERYNPNAYDSFEYLANEMRSLLERRLEQAGRHTE